MFWKPYIYYAIVTGCQKIFEKNWLSESPVHMHTARLIMDA